MPGCAKIIIKHLRGYKNIEYDVWNETGEKGTGCIREINKGETTDMYLKKFQMKNFRKYREESNTIMFVNSDGVRRKRKSSETEENKDAPQNDEVRGEEIQRETEDSKSESSIDVASATTLIVGKNNAGKTSIIYALWKIIKNTETEGFQISDFNFHYLKECFDEYLKAYEESKKTGVETTFEPPFMEFVITIAFEEDSNDLLTNLIPFMLLKDIDEGELDIILRYEAIEKSEFSERIKAALKKIETRKNEAKAANKKFDAGKEFHIFLRELEEVSFQIKYYRKPKRERNEEQNEEQQQQEEEQLLDEVGEKFKISNVMDIKFIRANNVRKDEELSEAFNKIISYRYGTTVANQKPVLDEQIDKMNDDLTECIQNHHSTDINNAIGKIISSDVMGVDLSSNITEEKLVRGLLRYAYVEKGMNIPEGQFGLGYTHLVKIVAELIDYMEHYPDEMCNGKINLIAIEEPESFMHPQMQELFIKNINDALETLIDDKKKNINSQLIITTHSSHVLNSKIHMGNSLDDICYVYEEGGYACAQNLDNNLVVSDIKKKKDIEKNKDFKFLIKHMKYKVSEMFFADAVILVEGFAEETILPFYLEQEENEELSKRYISIFGISGAHAYLYEKLLKKLRIPAVIITDLDIERNKSRGKDEKTPKEFPQIMDLIGHKTTNRTIKYFNGNSDDSADLSKLEPFIERDNIYVTYQWKIGNYFPTSFEEAFILTNADNEILNDILKSMKKTTYMQIVEKDGIPDYEQNRERSYEWQVKLSDAKGEFASRLLYALVTEPKEKRPKLPEYIQQGLEWLSKRLEQGNEYGTE